MVDVVSENGHVFIILGPVRLKNVVEFMESEHFISSATSQGFFNSMTLGTEQGLTHPKVHTTTSKKHVARFQAGAHQKLGFMLLGARKVIRKPGQICVAQVLCGTFLSLDESFSEQKSNI